MEILKKKKTLCQLKLKKIKDKVTDFLMRKAKLAALQQLSNNQKIKSQRKQEKFNLEENHLLEEKNKQVNSRVILMKVSKILTMMVM